MKGLDNIKKDESSCKFLPNLVRLLGGETSSFLVVSTKTFSTKIDFICKTTKQY